MSLNELVEMQGLGFQITNIVYSAIIPILFSIGGFLLIAEKIAGKNVLRWTLIGRLIFSIGGIIFFWVNYFTLPEAPPSGAGPVVQVVNTSSLQYQYYLEVLVFGFALYLITRLNPKIRNSGDAYQIKGG